jgi:hypothetical protein
MRAYLVIGVLGSLGEQLTQHCRISRQDRVDLCFYHFCACTRRWLEIQLRCLAAKCARGERRGTSTTRGDLHYAARFAERVAHHLDFLEVIEHATAKGLALVIGRQAPLHGPQQRDRAAASRPAWRERASSKGRGAETVHLDRKIN